MSSEQTPRVGEHVGVPSGLDTLEGVVVRTYKTPSGTRAVVSLDVPGADDPSHARLICVLPIFGR
jgi:hypothetical protein